MSDPNQHAPRDPHGKQLLGLTLAALGVVYGDIGTSPLYAMRECFSDVHGLVVNQANVVGVLSVIFWALMVVVTIKYVSVMLRVDNNGEGGILALLALVRTKGGGDRLRRRLVLFALFGSALLYGEGVITPPISVLGALEGITVVVRGSASIGPRQESLITGAIPWIAALILIGLFALQRFGTNRVGKSFAPIMLIWFTSIGAWGLLEIIETPDVLSALNPWYAINFFATSGKLGFLILGAVVLVFTGGEALYADMGHFGARPIRYAWFGLVLPCLLLNYFGQGALLLSNPEARHNPFYELVPKTFLIPMLIVATLAAITASQALISGSFSITRQAIQLGYIPRLTVRHTSAQTEGQIYVPAVNWLLMTLCLACIAIFQSSDKLAAAYGVAVTGTMSITSLLFGHVARFRWNWPLSRVLLVTGSFLVVDLSFFSANIIKFVEGGWFPMLLATSIFTLMTTWKRGRVLLVDAMKSPLSVTEFLESMARSKLHRTAGTAVVMTSDPEGVPPVLLHQLKHLKAIHQTVILLSVETAEVPTVPPDERLTSQQLSHGFHRATARYGFMESPNIPALIPQFARFGVVISPGEVSYILGRETVLTVKGGKLSLWRKRLFTTMTRNAQSATAFFNLPPNRVIEMGGQVQI